GTVAGDILGAPVLASLIPQDFEVVDAAAGTLAFYPASGLRPAAHYRVSVNRSGSLRHSKHGSERVEGALSWSFFTEGYEPLRVTAVYPRPYSRVRPKGTPIVVSFSRDLFRGDAAGWVAVAKCAAAGVGGGEVELGAALYDPPTKSLVLEPAVPGQGFPPRSAVRVRIRPRRVCGSEGESLEPLQADGLLKTSSFRFRFFTTHGASEVSRYEFNNADSAGVAQVLQR
ncbi:hypothetical protein T484DRAFT_1883043, partial [Baffinella frigidus]